MGDYLAILKFASIMLTGSFAIFGLFVDYKDKSTGKITKGGKAALAGIIISTLVAVASHALEQRKELEAARDATNRTLVELQRHSAVLSAISKTLQPLTGVKLTFAISINVDDAEFAAYKARLAHGIELYLQKYPKQTPELEQKYSGILALASYLTVTTQKTIISRP